MNSRQMESKEVLAVGWSCGEQMPSLLRYRVSHLELFIAPSGRREVRDRQRKDSRANFWLSFPIGVLLCDRVVVIFNKNLQYSVSEVLAKNRKTSWIAGRKGWWFYVTWDPPT
jgi:hypothetical protein